MAKKLYKVTGTMVVTVMIVAEDASHAEREAEDALHDEYHENSTSYFWDMDIPIVVERLEQIPKEWRGSIPYGEGDYRDRSCVQVLDSYVPYVPQCEPLGEQLDLGVLKDEP